MAGKIDWEGQLGRRLRLRDLHVFATVAERRSMAKAAIHLGVSQPAVSEVIAQLERELGVTLLEREPRGVELTIFGKKLLARSIAAFDELKQGVRELEYMADPAAGELRIGCSESIATLMMPAVLNGFLKKYPRAVLHIEPLTTPTFEMPMLRDRTLDLLFARINSMQDDHHDLNLELLFSDHLLLVTGAHHPLAQRRKIKFEEVAEQPWLLAPARSWNTRILQRTFTKHGLPMPRSSVVCYSFHLRASMLADGRFVTAMPYSAMLFAADRYSLKVLPVEISNDPWPIGVVTLKNRNLSPVAQVFIDHLRDFIVRAAPDHVPEAAKRRARSKP